MLAQDISCNLSQSRIPTSCTPGHHEREKKERCTSPVTTMSPRRNTRRVTHVRRSSSRPFLSPVPFSARISDPTCASHASRFLVRTKRESARTHGAHKRTDASATQRENFAETQRRVRGISVGCTAVATPRRLGDSLSSPALRTDDSGEKRLFIHTEVRCD